MNQPGEPLRRSQIPDKVSAMNNHVLLDIGATDSFGPVILTGANGTEHRCLIRLRLDPGPRARVSTDGTLLHLVFDNLDPVDLYHVSNVPDAQRENVPVFVRYYPTLGEFLTLLSALLLEHHAKPAWDHQSREYWLAAWGVREPLNPNPKRTSEDYSPPAVAS